MKTIPSCSLAVSAPVSRCYRSQERGKNFRRLMSRMVRRRGDVDLAAEAIRLARQLAASTDEPEVAGLLALFLLHHARRPARTRADGNHLTLRSATLRRRLSGDGG